MRRVGFDYPNTCPVIDRQINSAKDVITAFLDSLLLEACPLLPVETREELAKKNADLLYMDLEPCFEVVRKSNEDMRDEADRQIVNLQDSISDLEADIARLEREAA